MDRQTDEWTDKQTDRHMDRHRQTDRRTDGQTNKQIDIWMDTDRRTDGWMDRQTNKILPPPKHQTTNLSLPQSDKFVVCFSPQWNIKESVTPNPADGGDVFPSPIQTDPWEAVLFNHSKMEMYKKQCYSTRGLFVWFFFSRVILVGGLEGLFWSDTKYLLVLIMILLFYFVNFWISTSSIPLKWVLIV